MRNLKKILALALALTMVLSMMVTASAAFTDEDKFDADYEESVKVLAGMEVFQGFPDGSFKPLNTITRAQVAAILYRIDTQDVKDERADLFKGTAQFSDVGNEWYAGYVGYCANAGYIKGFPDGTFRPDDEVTGIQTLAMILRAIGYDRKDEFSGSQWANEIAKIATQLDILDDVKPGQLSGDASRELVAELLFEAIQQKTVSYSSIRENYVKNTYSLADAFELTKTGRLNDAWGRPYYAWEYLVDGDEESTKFYETPNATFYVETNDCEIAAELDEDEDFKLEWWENGKHLGGYEDHDNNRYTDEVFVADLVEFDVSDRKAYRGGQGVILEFYDNEVVKIDTYLAEVTDVEEVEYDRKGHIEENAILEFDAYYYANGRVKAGEKTSDEDFEYEVGDMLLVHFDEEVAAGKSPWTIVGLADSMVGEQTAYTNTATHVIDGEEYPDAETFYADNAEDKATTYNWFFNQFGDLIGAFEIADVYSYGVISSIYWKDSNNGENGYAVAKITYMDGTDETVEIVEIDGYETQGVEGKNAEYVVDGKDKIAYVSSTKQYNKTLYTNNMLYKIANDDGECTLTSMTTLEDAQVETGVAMILKNKAHANKSTMFLVWDGEEYTTYTGIKNVPDFEEGTYWAAELSAKDIEAEYVFITEDAYDEADMDDALFFSEEGDKLTIRAELTSKKVKYYSIKGGYVNGVEGEILTKSKDIRDEIEASQGRLLYLTMEDGYVTKVEYVIDEDTWVDSIEADALYLGDTYKLELSKDESVMYAKNADDDSFYVDEAVVISFNDRSLKKNIEKAKDGEIESYTYVIYTQNSRHVKTAQYIIITECFDVERHVAIDDLTDYIKDEIYKEALNGSTDTDDKIAARAKSEYALTDDTTIVVADMTTAEQYNIWVNKLLNQDYADVAAIEKHLGDMKTYFTTDANWAELYVAGMTQVAPTGDNFDLETIVDNSAFGNTIVLGKGTYVLPEFMTSQDGEGTTTNGLTIDGQGVATLGYVGVRNSEIISSLTIKNCTIVGSDTWVLSCIEDLAPNAVITFENCTFKLAEGQKDYALYLTMTAGAKYVIKDCTFDGDFTKAAISAQFPTAGTCTIEIKGCDFSNVVGDNYLEIWNNGTVDTDIDTDNIVKQ